MKAQYLRLLDCEIKHSCMNASTSPSSFSPSHAMRLDSPRSTVKIRGKIPLHSVPRHQVSLWSPEEDQQLLDALRSLQREDWSQVAKSLPGRTGKQCWHRFHYHLKHEFRIGDWTPEEDDIILQQQALVGNRWTQIAEMLPGRSENSVKNRWHCSLRNRLSLEGLSTGPNIACSDKGTVRRKRAAAGQCRPCVPFASYVQTPLQDGLIVCKGSGGTTGIFRALGIDPSIQPASATAHETGLIAAGDFTNSSIVMMSVQTNGVNGGDDGDGGSTRTKFRHRSRSQVESPSSPGRHTRHLRTLRRLLLQPQLEPERRPESPEPGGLSAPAASRTLSASGDYRHGLQAASPLGGGVGLDEQQARARRSDHDDSDIPLPTEAGPTTTGLGPCGGEQSAVGAVSRSGRTSRHDSDWWDRLSPLPASAAVMTGMEGGLEPGGGGGVRAREGEENLPSVTG
jgi:hypothetical protein